MRLATVTLDGCAPSLADAHTDQHMTTRGVTIHAMVAADWRIDEACKPVWTILRCCGYRPSRFTHCAR